MPDKNFKILRRGRYLTSKYIPTIMSSGTTTVSQRMVHEILSFPLNNTTFISLGTICAGTHNVNDHD
jgi:hypothetical protein